MLVVPLRVPLDLKRTLQPLGVGRLDPAMRFDGAAVHWAFHTADGPASLALRHCGDHLEAEAWGPGAERALGTIEARVGLEDDAEDFRPEHPALRRLAVRLRGVRLARVEGVAELLFPTVLQQLVTWQEAARAYANLVRRFGEAAPGPLELTLSLSGAQLAQIPPAEYVAAGALGKQGRTLREIGRLRRKLETVREMSGPDASALLQKVPGVGPWTAHSIMLRGLGFADAVPTGDFHLPKDVAFLLAGEHRADDARMLELLAPYSPHRGRVIRMALGSGVSAPKRGPKHRIRPMGTR